MLFLKNVIIIMLFL